MDRAFLADVAAEAAFPYKAFYSALSQHPLVPVGVEADEAFAFHEAHSQASFTGRQGVDYLTQSDVEALGSSAVNAAMELKASAIVVLSHSGRSAAAVAKYRPSVPVLVLVTNEAVAHSLQLLRGVHAILLREEELGGKGPLVARLKEKAIALVKEWGIAKKSDRVVMCHGIGADLTEGMAVSVAKVH